MTKYYPSSIKYTVDPEKGIIQEIGDVSTFTFVSGTTVELDAGANIAYSPENPGDWSNVPTNLVEAVDYLAAGSGSGGGGGGGTPGGSNGDIQYRVDGTTFGGVNKLTFVGGNLVGTGSFNGVFSGSLTKLTDGSPYLVAGTNITLSTGSSGAVTINSDSITGSIKANEIAFGTASGVISGSGDLTFDGTSLNIRSQPGGDTEFFTVDGNTLSLWVHDSLGGNVDSVRVSSTGITVDSSAGGGNPNLVLETVSGTPKINASSGNSPLDLVLNELQINGVPGSSGQVLTSQGAGSAPIWTTPVASAVSGSSKNIVYVAKNGSDTSVSGSVNSPFLTIQGAISYVETNRPSVFANDQDVAVVVAPGTYSEDITFTKPFINVMGYVPTQYSKATQLRGLVNINNTSDPGGGTGQIFGLYNFLITAPTTASANVISFSGTGNGSLVIENTQVVGGGSNQSILYVSKSAAVQPNCRVKARHSIFNIETAGSAGPTANIFNVYSVFESCEIGYNGGVSGGTVINSDTAVVEFTRGTLTAGTSNSIVAKITGSITKALTVGDTAVGATPAATEINGFLLAPGAYLFAGKNAYSLPVSATKFVVSGSAGSTFVTAFDAIFLPGVLYNTRISNTMTTLFASASFTKVT